MMDGKQIGVYSTLSAIYKLFPTFLRPHVSYLINADHLRSVRHHTGILVTLKFCNDEKLYFHKSKKFYPSFFSSLSSKIGSGDEKGE